MERAISALLVWWLATSPLGAIEPAELVLTGGKIVTLDGQQRVVDALAVRDGKLIAVGRVAEVQPLIESRTEAIRFDGKAVLPGLIESHCHAVGVARVMLDQTYCELSGIAEMQDWIRQAARDALAGRQSFRSSPVGLSRWQ